MFSLSKKKKKRNSYRELCCPSARKEDGNQRPLTNCSGFALLCFHLVKCFSLVIYVIHSIDSVYISILISQFNPASLSSLGVHMCVFYVCVSLPALQRGSPLPFLNYFKWDVFQEKYLRHQERLTNDQNQVLHARVK